MKGIEYIKHNNQILGIVLRSSLKVKASTFFSPKESSLQVGIIKHKKEYREVAHTHKEIKKIIFDVEQLLFVKKGKGSIDFFVKTKKIRSVMLKKGDAILIIQGIHALNVFQNFEALTIKQGPFLGKKLDKLEVTKK